MRTEEEIRKELDKMKLDYKRARGKGEKAFVKIGIASLEWVLK